ncbi:hypothetical protein Tco_1110447 [Tanacetum coccineum]|uniref:Retrovirus-related Pol polyprotein from transposon TNT 1-94-like beta-barrel domain-containing protein n=1 Tax=Tanacetum coccineum TaxID=301880 RepID=A0ABQ5IJ31_9ASTR
MAFMSSPSSTNEVNTAYEVNTANIQVSPASTQVSTASTQVSTANLCDATVYAFLANQPNRSQLVHEDLEQIYEDDLEEIDLKWQLALLSMRTRRLGVLQDCISWDILLGKCEDLGMEVEDDEVPTNMALMAFSDSEEKLIGSQIYLISVEKRVGFASFNAVPPPTYRCVSDNCMSNWLGQSLLDALLVDEAIIQTVVILSGKTRVYEAVKDLACLRLVRPTKLNSASIIFKRHNYVDARGRSNGCSRHMTRYMSYLSDFKEFNGGYVTFGGGAKGGRITGKGTLKTGKLDFEDVYFVKELQFNLFSVSQMCDKKNSVLFTDTGCFVLSPDFKLTDESQVLLKVPRKNNMYSVDMKNIVPKESLTCLVAKATLDESMLWHRRLGKATQSLLFMGVLFSIKDVEVVNTALLTVKNMKSLVVKLITKTPYELFRG